MTMASEATLKPVNETEATRLTHGSVAQVLSSLQNNYDYQQYLSVGADGGLNLPTALAAIHAIDAKGQTQGWEYQDLLNALPATKVALTTAGYANARDGLEALLTGATGKMPEILEHIVPSDAPKRIKAIVGTMVVVNALDNMRRVGVLLIDEKKLESRFLQLAKIQREILLNPGRTRALLSLLNAENLKAGSLAGTGVQEEAREDLQRISPFSLEDMAAINHLFKTIEWRRNSSIQTERQQLFIEEELNRFGAAGRNLATIVSRGTSETVEALLLLLGGTVGGVVGGSVLAYNEGRYQIEKALQDMKRRNEKREAVKA